MLLTTYEINRGDNCIVLTIKPIQNLSTISATLRLGQSDIDYIKKTIIDCKAEDLTNHYIYTLAREYMKKITQHLAEATHFIQDENLSGAIVQYCKQNDNDEIQIMSKETYDKMYNETLETIKELFEF